MSVSNAQIAATGIIAITEALLALMAEPLPVSTHATKVAEVGGLLSLDKKILGF
jgi:hypothetical protein